MSNSSVRSLVHATTALNATTVSDLTFDVAPPTYDRSSLREGVVHIGVGGFHRAHQAVYFDDIARRGLSRDWGVVGVGLHSACMSEALWPQDCLYTVVERSEDSTEGRVVGIMSRYLHGATRPEAVLATLSHPDTRLVTLTVTGNGYNLDGSGKFVTDHPSVLQELATPDRPDTAFGYLVEALRRRRRDGLRPFTVLSCDNIPRNGAASREMLVSFAALRDPSLARWISQNVSFPSSVVDRITPETTARDRRDVARWFGVADRWPVITEPFSQWVIEDDFCNGRPPLDQVGVQFVDDVSSFELIKKRLLNGSHCAIAYLGYLAGHRTTSEVMSDPVFSGFVDELIDEIMPLLPTTPGLDLYEYKASLLKRLGNPAIADQLSRLCRRGSTKMPAYLLPSIEDTISAGPPPRLMTLAIAGWFHYLTGTDFSGDPIEIDDPLASELVPLARTGVDCPRSLLAVRTVFDRLGDDSAFVDELEIAYEAIAKWGPRRAVELSLDARVSR